MKRNTKTLLCVLCAVAAVLCVVFACFMLTKKQSGTTASSAASGASVSVYGKVSDFDYSSFDYSEGLDDNGHWTGIRALDYVTLPDNVSALPLSKADIEPTEAEIQTQIDTLLNQYATTQTITGRAAQSGDTVNIDYSGAVDGVAFTGGTATGYDLTLGSHTFIDGFEDQIIGHSIGDEFDVNVKFPEDYAPELAAKDAVFKVKLHEIKVKELPELDDEFAKDMGEYETVDELKKGIEEDMLKRKQDSAQHAFEDAVIEAICENVEGEIPECMYENKAKENTDSFAQRVAQQGIDLDTYLMYMGMDRAAFDSQMKERAVADVKIELAVEKIIELENIKASDEAVAEEYQKMADMYKLEVEKIKELVPEATVAAELAKQDAIKLVIDSAKAKKPAAKRAAAKKKDTASEEKPEAEAKAEKKPAAKKTTKKKEQPAE